METLAMRVKERRGWAALMVMIDDATGRLFARLFENESWDSAAVTLRRYTQRHGLPRALYVDGHRIYRADWEPMPDEILAGSTPKTPPARPVTVRWTRWALPSTTTASSACGARSSATSRWTKAANSPRARS